MTAPSAETRIARVVLDGSDRLRMSPAVARDVGQAISEIESDSSFKPRQLDGPFILHLRLQNARLVLDMRDAGDKPLHTLALSLSPFRRLIKDYLLILDSHALAVLEGRGSRLEAIDMGRRALHNEGAALIKDRLDGKVVVDMETARKLFTLICVLNLGTSIHGAASGHMPRGADADG